MGDQNLVRGRDVDWNNLALQRWLGAITNRNTIYNYRSCFRAYAKFTGMSATELIDEAIEDSRRDPRERRDIVLRRLIGFYNWLKTEYPVKSRGKGKHRVIGKGTTGRSAEMRVNAIRSFYATFDITVRMKGKHKLPKSKVENKRVVFKPEDVWKVKVLVDNARSPRDRALILFHLQGGFDVSTLCSLNYGDVKDGLAKNEHPLKIEPSRVKTGVDFYTFVGKDAIDALKAYLADMRSRGVNFRGKTPLFLQERGKGRLKPHNVQTMMKDLVVRSGFVSDDNNGYAFNPLGTHSLRETFGSLMTNSGVPDTIVDFWLGHEIGEMASAYKSVQFESLKKMYQEREHLISITPKTNVEEIKEKLRGELEQQNRQMQNLINGLATENMDLKQRVQTLENTMVDLTEKWQHVDKKTRELVKHSLESIKWWKKHHPEWVAES